MYLNDVLSVFTGIVWIMSISVFSASMRPDPVASAAAFTAFCARFASEYCFSRLILIIASIAQASRQGAGKCSRRVVAIVAGYVVNGKPKPGAATTKLFEFDRAQRSQIRSAIAQHPLTDDIWISTSTQLRIYSNECTLLYNQQPALYSAGVACDANNEAFLADFELGNVVVCGQQGQSLRLLREHWSSGLYGNLIAELKFPTHVAVDGKGLVYVSLFEASSISVFKRDGTFVKSLCSHGSGQLTRQSGLAIAETGEIVVADTGNARVQVLSADGSFLRAIDGKSPGIKAAEAFRPLGVTVDSEQNVFVTDGNNKRVLIFKLDGTLVTTFATSVDSCPGAVCVDKDRRAFVADTSGVSVFAFQARSLIMKRD